MVRIMMVPLALVAGCLAAALGDDRERFDAWKRDFAIDIDAGDYERRLEIFSQKLRSMEAHDARHFRLGLNRFSHLTEDEFAALYRRPMLRRGPAPGNRFCALRPKEGRANSPPNLPVFFSFPRRVPRWRRRDGISLEHLRFQPRF